jgi:hypothetical protein
MKKALIVSTAAAILAALAIPTTAVAGPEQTPVSTCQTLPVATPGISVLGQRIPSASDVSVCAAADTVVQAIPAIVEQPECGSPCFTVEIDGLKVSENLRVSVRYKLDGKQEEISYAPGPIAADPGAGSSLCVVGVGYPDPCTDRVTTPQNLSANAKANRSGSRINLTWAASKATRKATVVGYKVWRSVTGQHGTFEEIAASTTTSFVDTTVSPGTTYWYYVVAWDDGGRYSPASDTASATAR